MLQWVPHPGSGMEKTSRSLLSRNLYWVHQIQCKTDYNVLKDCNIIKLNQMGPMSLTVILPNYLHCQCTDHTMNQYMFIYTFFH
jgi:hypothetical protein